MPLFSADAGAFCEFSPAFLLFLFPFRNMPYLVTVFQGWAVGTGLLAEGCYRDSVGGTCQWILYLRNRKADIVSGEKSEQSEEDVGGDQRLC